MIRSGVCCVVGHMGIGPLELGIVLVIVLIIMGPKRLPGVGKQLGSSMREFKDAITGRDKPDERPALRPGDAVEPSTPVAHEHSNA